MPSVTIRDARAGEAPAVREVARRTWHAAYDDVLGTETVDRLIDEWYDVEGLRAAIEETTFVVAVDEGVVGFANARPHPKRTNAFWLNRIYVRPARWGEGVGNRLLDRIVEDARAAGAGRLRLAVFAENDVGVSFYESRGFERIASETVEFDGEPYEEYRYELSW